MNTTNKLNLSQSDKNLLKKVSESIGAKADNIKAVWEYTILTELLDIDPEAKFKKITLPFIGSIAIKLKDAYSIDEQGETITQDMEPFIALDPQFKKLLEDASNNNYEAIASILREKLLEFLS